MFSRFSPKGQEEGGQEFLVHPAKAIPLNQAEMSDNHETNHEPNHSRHLTLLLALLPLGAALSPNSVSLSCGQPAGSSWGEISLGVMGVVGVLGMMGMMGVVGIQSD